MASETGSGWQGDATPLDEPPPTPFERGSTAGTAGPTGPADAPRTPGSSRGRRRGRTVLLVGIAAALIASGGLILDGRLGPSAGGEGAGSAVGPVADDVLLELLAAVDASERVMLDFDDAARAAFEGAASEEEALALVGRAAADAVAGLLLGRDGLEEPLRVAVAEDVRVAYLPHLDAWVAYLEAVAEDPVVLLGAEQEALILRINATAGVFVAALEETVAAGVGAEVEAAARAIIDQGFPDEDEADL